MSKLRGFVCLWQKKTCRSGIKFKEKISKLLPSDAARQAVVIAYSRQIAIGTFKWVATGAANPFQSPEAN